MKSAEAKTREVKRRIEEKRRDRSEGVLCTVSDTTGGRAEEWSGFCSRDRSQNPLCVWTVPEARTGSCTVRPCAPSSYAIRRNSEDGRIKDIIYATAANTMLHTVRFRFEYRISVYLMRVIEPPQPIVDRGGTVSEVHPCSHGVGRNRIAEAVVYEDT